MTLRWILLPALLAVGCHQPLATLPLVPPSERAEKIDMIVVSADGSTKKVSEEVAADRSVGSYYQGDHTGYNLYLDLKEDGRFSCRWKGCLGGGYGNSWGWWSVTRDGLKIVAERSEGMFEAAPLENLDVVSLRGHFLLVQQRDRGRFAEWGPDRVTCFHQEVAQEAVDEHRRRSLSKGLKK